MLKRIGVLGGGNGAFAMAADLTVKGYEVNLCESPLFGEGFKAVQEKRVVTLVDCEGSEKTVELKMATTNLEEALEHVDYIMMAMAATGHEHFFESMLPFLRDGQTIVTWPGYFSALRFNTMLRTKKVSKAVIFAESHTFPFACRFVAPCKVRIFLEGRRILVSSFPGKFRDKVVDDLRPLYPIFSCQNTLSTSLNDPNPIVHPIVMILNAVPVETRSDFHFYRDGVTLPVARAIKAVRDEMAKILSTMGIEPLEYPEESYWLKSGIMSAYFKTPFDKEGAAASIDGPHFLKHRFITEDVPFGLVPSALLARKLGIEVPVISAMIEICSLLNNTNYWKTGTSLEDLGLDVLSARDIPKFLENGTL
jgi:opine dehydrogenase